MSPLWNKERLRVFLKPGGLTIAQVRGRLRTHIDHKVTLVNTDSHWQASIDALSTWLDNNQPAPLEIVFSAHYTRFLCLPWDSTLIEEVSRLALARALFERQHAPEDANAFSFRLAAPAFGRPQLAVAVEQQLLMALQQLSTRHAQPLLSATPLLESVWNQFQRQFAPSGTLAIAEENRLLLARFERRHIVEAQLRPMDPHTLKHSLLSPLAEGPLYLFAPQLGPAGMTAGNIRRLTLPSVSGFSPLSDTDQAFGLCGAL